MHPLASCFSHRGRVLRGLSYPAHRNGHEQQPDSFSAPVRFQTGWTDRSRLPWTVQTAKPPRLAYRDGVPGTGSDQSVHEDGAARCYIRADQVRFDGPASLKVCLLLSGARFHTG